MTVGIFSLRRPTPERIAAALEEARAQRPTYDDVGATRTTLPAGYRHDRYQLHLGHGERAFARGVEALDSWAAQRSVGITVTPDVRPVEGETVVQCIRVLAVWVLAACRIVYRIDEPDRAGFAYGSLPAHPERGEEAFLVERDATGVVRARIVVFSRPRHWLMRLGGPVPRLVQRHLTRGYLRGIRRQVTAAGDSDS